MSSRMTRDQLLRRGAAGVTFLSLPGLLAACGGGDDAGDAGEVLNVLNFANWPLYIDVEEGTNRRPSIEMFTEETGIRVNYFEEINDNAEYFARIQGPLGQGQPIDRDIFVFTDNSRFPGLLIEQEWVEPLVKDLIPNISNLIPAQASPPFDPDREFSLPWQSGMTGIAWNEDVTGPVESIEQLLEDPALRGKVTMLYEMADSVGLVILANGDDPGAVDDDVFNRAADRIQAAVDSGQIRRFTGNDYAAALTQGDLAACIAWSGDVIQLLADNPNLEWGVPADGGMIWTDNMLIPKGGSAATASTYMNFVYDPAIMALISGYVNFVPPVTGTKEELAKTDPETAGNTLIFPDEALLEQLHQYDSAALNNDEHILRWQRVTGQ